MTRVLGTGTGTGFLVLVVAAVHVMDSATGTASSTPAVTCPLAGFYLVTHDHGRLSSCPGGSSSGRAITQVAGKSCIAGI